MKEKQLFMLGCMAMMGLAFTSCSHDEFLYDSEAEEKILDAQYEANFIKRYGEIDPNQTWDFTTMQPIVSLPSSEAVAKAKTRGETDSNVFTTGNMTVDKDVIHYLLSNLPKGNNNTPKGRVFSMYSTGQPFTIVPVFQGCASYYWELWISVAGLDDKKIWSKGEDFEYRKVGTDKWMKPGTGTDGMKRNSGDLEVYAPTFTFSGIKTQNLAMSFYLKVWKTYSGMTGYEVYQKYQEEPTNLHYQPVKSSSLDNWMIDLQNATKPTNLPEGNEVTIIGCEDATASGSDRDFEDLVFMVYGNPVPPTKRVKEVITSVTKRYMMEDLGDIDDFDFNDVVVDVSNRTKTTYYYASADAADTEYYDFKKETLPQQAIVRAAGGTINFTLTIGKTSWTKSGPYAATSMLNTGWGGTAINENASLATFEVSGWDPESNNVSVTVVKKSPNTNEEGVMEIKFPKVGTAPKIIAVEADIPWRVERQAVPFDWFY